MRQGFLVGSPLEGMCASATPVLYRLWIQARLGVVMRQEHRLAICLLGKVHFDACAPPADGLPVVCW